MFTQIHKSKVLNCWGLDIGDQVPMQARSFSFKLAIFFVSPRVFPCHLEARKEGK